MLANPIFQNTADTLTRSIGSGTAYGLAVTYDFKSADSKVSGYVSPRILFASASGSGIDPTTNGAFTTNTSETNIGLTTGADYAISSGLTAGLSVTYDFSRSGTFTATDSNGKLSAPISGGNFKLGINFGYNF